MSDRLLEGLSYLKILSDELREKLPKKEERLVVESTLDNPQLEGCTQEVMVQNNEPSLIAAQELIRAEREKIKKAKENSLREMEILKEKLAEEMGQHDHLKKLIEKHENCGYGAWFKMMEDYGNYGEDLEVLRRDVDKCQNHEMYILETNSQLLRESQEKLATSLEKRICQLQSLLHDLKQKELQVKISIDAEEDKHSLISSDIRNAWGYIREYQKKVTQDFIIHKRALKKKEELIVQAKKLTSAAQNVCN